MTSQLPGRFWLAGEAREGARVVEVRSPWDGSSAGAHWEPGPDQVEAAVAAADRVRHEMAATSAASRASALDTISGGIARRSEEFARTITAESGKPLMWSRAEVGRAVSTFRWAAEEARRWSGTLQRLDTDPAATGRLAVVRRFPRGPVLGIAPFNFPLNLVAHKVAPAIAVGAPIIVKPAPATPLTALLLGDVMAETDLPAGAWSILPLGNPETAALVHDPRLPVVSFTGSERVGYEIQAAVPGKQVVLELGGNAAAVVLGDWCGDDELDWAARRIATFGNYQAGQSCISVQRVIVEDSVAERFVGRLVERVRGLRTGSPWDDEVVVGPMISEQAAARAESWIQEAVLAGARVLVGGGRRRSELEPTLLIDAPREAKVNTEEIFGPVMTVTTVRDSDQAFALVNDSRFGLQAGVFTRDIETAFRAQSRLDVGGVVIGDVPSFRADQMPYGGVKASGVGREGPHAAMMDLTVERVMVLTGLDL